MGEFYKKGVASWIAFIESNKLVNVGQWEDDINGKQLCHIAYLNM